MFRLSISKRPAAVARCLVLLCLQLIRGCQLQALLTRLVSHPAGKKHTIRELVSDLNIIRHGFDVSFSAHRLSSVTLHKLLLGGASDLTRLKATGEQRQHLQKINIRTDPGIMETE